MGGVSHILIQPPSPSLSLSALNALHTTGLDVIPEIPKLGVA